MIAQPSGSVTLQSYSCSEMRINYEQKRIKVGHVICLCMSSEVIAFSAKARKLSAGKFMKAEMNKEIHSNPKLARHFHIDRSLFAPLLPTFHPFESIDAPP
jgi:hypothetical protein